MVEFIDTGLWKRTLGAKSPTHRKERENLRQSYLQLRDSVKLLSEDIAIYLPTFTVHNITHIDALWEIADVIAGPRLILNPLEAYVLGCSFLIHDLGMGLVSWPRGEKELQEHPMWLDTVTALFRKKHSRMPSSVELNSLDDSVRRLAIEDLLRRLHAEHAESLLEAKWKVEGREEISLLEDSNLRSHLGRLIGRIAHSHWWGIDQLGKEFRRERGAPPHVPREWNIDPLKVASLLRVADAAHLDERRAPRLLRVARKISGEARSHWIFQEHLGAPSAVGDRLRFTSTKPFTASEANAWWLAKDTLQMVDRELRSVDALLFDTGRQQFALKGVIGIESASRFAEFIPVIGWEPVEARVSVSNVAKLVQRLGGRELYGNDPTIPLRELIQNGVDSVRARRILERRPDSWGKVTIRSGNEKEGAWIEVEDSGLGMSDELLTGALLDFGESYWMSPQSREEHPGLAAGGFMPIGKFGIGFFSVFMWGSRVSISTCQYQSAPSSTRVLEFSHGLHSMPLLRPAAQGERLSSGTTRVRVWLLDNPTSITEYLSSRFVDSGELDLPTLCAKLVPASPVDLVVESEKRKRIAVKANDWIKLSGVSLLERISWYEKPFLQRRDVQKWLEGMSKRLQLVTDVSGNVIGRACLEVPSLSPITQEDDDLAPTTYSPPSAVTIGGIASSSHLRGVAGILSGTPLGADRMSAVPNATEEDMQAWVTAQVPLLRRIRFDRESTRMAGLLHLLGAETGRFPIAHSSLGPVTSGELGKQFKDAQEVQILFDSTYRLLELKGQKLRLNDETIAVGLGKPSLLDSDRDRYVDWPVLRNVPANYAFQAGSLLGAVVRTLARAWEVSELAIWDASHLSEDETVRKPVGSYKRRQVFRPVKILRRPSQESKNHTQLQVAEDAEKESFIMYRGGRVIDL